MPINSKRTSDSIGEHSLLKKKAKNFRLRVQQRNLNKKKYSIDV